MEVYIMSSKHWIAASTTAAYLLAGSTAQAEDIYAKFFGGWTIPSAQDLDLENRAVGVSGPSELDFSSGFAAGVALGFTVSPSVALEIEYVYRHADAELGKGPSPTSGSITSNAIMVNAIYELPSVGATQAFRPYVGAGLGVGDMSYDGDDNLNLDGDYSFAYQAIAGIGYQVSNQASFYAEARYFGISNQTVKNSEFKFESDYGTADILFGYNYRF